MTKKEVTSVVKYIFDEVGASQLIKDFAWHPHNRWAKWASISENGDIEVWSDKPYPDDMQHICDAFGLMRVDVGKANTDVSQAWEGLVIKISKL